MSTYRVFNPIVKVRDGIEGTLNIKVSIVRFNCYLSVVNSAILRVLRLVEWGWCTNLVATFYFLLKDQALPSLPHFTFIWGSFNVIDNSFVREE